MAREIDLENPLEELIKIIANSGGTGVERMVLIRKLLTTISQEDMDLLEGFGGIKIVERFSDRPEGEDCFRYYFGDSDVQEVTDRMFREMQLAAKPVFGAFVLYLNQEGHPTHIGKVGPNGKVISKWGPLGHVVEHPIPLVPTNYGENLIFLIEQSVQG